ncbi:MAG: hypothetical protein ACOYM9_21850 [Bradymonadia bacterium]
MILVALALMLGAALVGFITQVHAARAASAVLVSTCAAALLWVGARDAPAAQSALVWSAEAHHDGRPVHVAVALEAAEGEREVRRLTLRKPVPGAGEALAGAAAILLLAVVAQGRRGGLRLARTAGALAGALAVVAGALMWSASGAGQGEPEVRGILAALPIGARPLLAFESPTVAWVWSSGPAFFLLALGAVALWSALGRTPVLAPAMEARLGAGAAAAAALVTLAQTISFGGPLVGPATGVLWASTLALTVSAFEVSPSRRAWLSAAACGLCAAALAVQ